MSLPEKPLTRRELYLAKAAGQDVALPETDLTREEMYLREIANGGGGGDVTKEYVDTAISNAVADIDDDISALSDTVADKVDKENGKSLSTNDYTDADKALVQDSPITVTATGAEITASTAQGNLNALTVYGKSEVVDGAIKSAGEGWNTVDLGTLTWEYVDGWSAFRSYSVTNAKSHSRDVILPLFVKDYIPVGYMSPEQPNHTIVLNSTYHANNALIIKDTDYTDPTVFQTAMSGVLLAYQLADPTQGNTIAVKTDDGSGINGTMATFTTGTPLRGIPDTDVRDVMAWDGSTGTVTKNCGEVDLGTLTWGYNTSSASNPFFYASDINIKLATSQAINGNLVCEAYNTYSFNTVLYDVNIDKAIGVNSIDNAYKLVTINTDYTDPSAFKTAMSGVKLVYELATPTTTPLTSTENASIAGLKTFTPQTHAQNNAGATMTIEAYAGTANGQAVSELKQDVQSEISALKITQSATLTLTVAGWTNNAQTVTYEHDIGKRNSIDVEPTSIKAWTAAGILATSETASTITFECDTVPTTDLSFRVTSMEVR